KAEFQLPPSRYPLDLAKWPNLPERQRFFSDLESRLQGAPGVEAVAVAGANPLDAGFTSSIRGVGREAETGDWPEPSMRAVSRSYFTTVHVPLFTGRAFEESDTQTSSAGPVVVINEAANRRFFNGRTALGQLIFLWGKNRVVIGVVGNERIKG